MNAFMIFFAVLVIVTITIYLLIEFSEEIEHLKKEIFSIIDLFKGGSNA